MNENADSLQTNLSSTTPAPGRPAGLVLAAIILALMTGWGLLTAASIIFVAVTVHSPQTAQFPIITVFEIGFGIVALLCSLFCGWTVVGLFRLQRWARYSILILGGLLAVFTALFAIFFAAFAFSSFLSTSNPSGVPPTTMRLIFLGMGAFNFLLTLIGIWWLVYFNLSKTRGVFGRSVAPVAYGETPSFETESTTLPVKRGIGAVEILLKCLAVLYLIWAPFGVLMALLRLPLFFLGFTFRGLSAAIVSLVLAAIGLGLGIGLLRRLKPAWVGAIAFNVLGMFSSAFLLIPRTHASLINYEQEINQRLFSWMGPLAQQPSQTMQGPMMILGFLVSFVFGILILWLLIRARPLFETNSTPDLHRS